MALARNKIWSLLAGIYFLSFEANHVHIHAILTRAFRLNSSDATPVPRLGTGDHPCAGQAQHVSRERKQIMFRIRFRIRFVELAGYPLVRATKVI
jgi:hypothetical protein